MATLDDEPIPLYEVRYTNPAVYTDTLHRKFIQARLLDFIHRWEDRRYPRSNNYVWSWVEVTYAPFDDNRDSRIGSALPSIRAHRTLCMEAQRRAGFVWLT